MSDQFDDERYYREGWIAGTNGQPQSDNPYLGRVDGEAMWKLGWLRGTAGHEYDGGA